MFAFAVGDYEYVPTSDPAALVRRLERVRTESHARRLPDDAAVRVRRTLLDPSSYPSGVSCGPLRPVVAFVVPDQEDREVMIFLDPACRNVLLVGGPRSFGRWLLSEDAGAALTAVAREVFPELEGRLRQ
jgi:hypothetical protein